MQNSLIKAFRDYSYLNDEIICSNILSKIDKKDLYEFENIDKLFLKLNKLIDIKDIIYTISKLETNIVMIDYALKDADDDFLYHLRELNKTNQKLVNTLFTMLDLRELD